MLDIKQIVRVIEDGQYIRVINTSGNDLLLPITLFGTAAETASLLDRINTLTSSHTIVIAAGVIRPYFTTVGQPIVWKFLDPDTPDETHNKLYFNGTITTAGNVITVNFPSATKVIKGVVNLDDSLASKKSVFGTGTGTSNMEIICKYNRSFAPVITNNGTTWNALNLGSGGTDAVLSYNAVTGVISITNIPYVTPTYNYIPCFGVKDPSLTIDARVRWVFDNLAIGQVKFQLVDSLGAPITGAPDANWTIHIGGEETPVPLIVDTLTTENQYIWEALSNLWLDAILQLD